MPTLRAQWVYLYTYDLGLTREIRRRRQPRLPRYQRCKRGPGPPWPRVFPRDHLCEGDHGHEPYLYTKIHISGRTCLVYHDHSLTRARSHAHGRARVCTWSCLQSRMLWCLSFPVESVLQVGSVPQVSWVPSRLTRKSIDHTYDF